MHPIQRLRRALCFSYTTGTSKMAAGIGNAPISHRFQRRANLSQLPSLKWSYRKDSHPQPLDYQSNALLLSYGRKSIGVVGFAPTQHKAPVLQTGPALSLRRTPLSKWSRRQDSHLLSRVSKTRISTPSTSPRMRLRLKPDSFNQEPPPLRRSS